MTRIIRRMSRTGLMRRRALRLGSPVIVAALAAGSVMLLAGSANGQIQPVEQVASSRSAANPADNPDLAPSAYGILGMSSRGGTGSLPTVGVAAERIQRLQLMFGLDLSAARMASGPTGAELWLIPGSRGHCVIEETATAYEGASCGAVDSTSGFIGWTQQTPDGDSVVGFVPNGNAEVELSRTDGTTVSIRVSENALFAETSSSAPFVTMRLVGLSGASETVPLLNGS